MIRWKYVIPRLVIVLVIAIAVYFGTNPVIRWSLIQTGQAAAGAKVDIGWVHSSLTDGRVEIEGIQIADKSNPDQNLVEADRAVLNLNVQGFFRRKFIVDEGRIDGIRFGTERMASGALPDKSKDADQSESSFAKKGQEIFGPWLDDVRSRLEVAAIEQSETAQVADELMKRWPREYEQLKKESQAIEARIVEVKRVIKEASDNPLRSVGQYERTLDEIPAITRDIETLYQKLNLLSQQVPKDREAILAAKERDKQKLQQMIQVRELDGEAISEFALGEENGGRVHEVAQWLAWIRAIMPDPKKDFMPERTRGVDIHFGDRREPDLLVRHLQLNGSGRIDGERYDVTGSLSGLSTQPVLYGKPAELRLVAEGAKTIHVSALLDRTSSVQRDQFRIQIPEMSMPAKSVGGDDSMQLAFNGGAMSLDCKLLIQEEKMLGQIRTTHRRVNLSVNEVSDSLGGDETAQILSNALAQVEGFDVTISLSGTLEDPEIKMETDFGPRVADKIELALRQELESRVQAGLNQLDQIANEKLASLERQFQQEYGEVASSLNLGHGELSRIRNEIASRIPFNRFR